MYRVYKEQVYLQESVLEEVFQGQTLCFCLSCPPIYSRVTANEAVMHYLSDSFTFLHREEPVVLDRVVSHTVYVFSRPSLRTRYSI